MSPNPKIHREGISAQQLSGATWADIKPYFLSLIATPICWVLQHLLIQFKGAHFAHHFPLFPYAPIAFCFAYFFTLKVVIFSIALDLIALWVFTPEIQLSLSDGVYSSSVGLIGCLVISKLTQARKSEKENIRIKADLMAMLSTELKGSLELLKSAVKEIEATSEALLEPNKLTNHYKTIDNISCIIDQCIELDTVLHKGVRIHSISFSINDLMMQIKQRKEQSERIRLHIPDDTIVKSDRFILERIITMLVENALKYAPSDAPIDISCGIVSRRGKLGTALRFINPVGPFGAPDKHHVFSRYYRAPGTEKISGSGLGLWLTKKLVDRLSGFIGLRLNNEQVVFDIWLPFDPKKPYFRQPPSEVSQ